MALLTLHKLQIPPYCLLGLRHEFHYLSREGSAFDVAIKGERRFRRRTGYLVPYRCVEADKLISQAKYSRYVAQTPHWEMIEVSNYAHVELPPCITYVGSRLKQDVTSGWWVVAYSEYLARMGCSLFKRYKKFNLFGASPGGFVAICGSSTYPWY